MSSSPNVTSSFLVSMVDEVVIINIAHHSFKLWTLQ